MDKILVHGSETRAFVRKMYNLDKPGMLEDAVRLLKEWIQKQPHFNKKDYNDVYLETSLYLNKGSLEKVKLQLDKMCTMRTLMPHFFGRFNYKTDFGHLNEVICTLLLPGVTEDHYRILVSKFIGNEFESSDSIHFFRSTIVFAEYARAHDFSIGLIIVLDFSEASVISCMTKLNPILLRQAMTLFIGGYGARIKAIHLISESKVIDSLVTLLKQVVSVKIADRIHVHKRTEDLHAFIPKKILPKDYGGDERSMKTLQEEWLNELSSEEHLNWLEEMSKATTNEACRPKEQFFYLYSGLPGTFRYLSVD